MADLKRAFDQSDGPTFSGYLAEVKKALDTTKKENDFIYFFSVPDATHLELIGMYPWAAIKKIPNPLSSDKKWHFLQKELTFPTDI